MNVCIRLHKSNLKLMLCFRSLGDERHLAGSWFDGYCLVIDLLGLLRATLLAHGQIRPGKECQDLTHLT